MEKFREMDVGRTKVLWTVKRNMYTCSVCKQQVKLINPRTQTCPSCEEKQKNPVLVQQKKEEVSNSGREIDW